MLSCVDKAFRVFCVASFGLGLSWFLEVKRESLHLRCILIGKQCFCLNFSKRSVAVTRGEMVVV